MRSDVAGGVLFRCRVVEEWVGDGASVRGNARTGDGVGAREGTFLRVDSRPFEKYAENTVGAGMRP